MKEEAATDALLRQFLLRKVDDETRQWIESLFLTDSDVKERVLAAEQKLIDDYLEDCLSPADQENFVSVYGDTSTQRRKLRIAKTIQAWAVDQQDSASLGDLKRRSVWECLRSRLQFKPLLAAPLAVVAVIVLTGAVWVSIRKTERHRQHLAVQQELTRLNTPSSLDRVQPQVRQLTPGLVRSVDPQGEIRASSVTELHLLWMQADYATFEAVVRRSGDDEWYLIPNLTAENEGRKFIRVRLPARLLMRGNYRIELRGLSADGSRTAPEVYSFAVSK